MQTPTTAQLRTAIEVLEKLAGRIDEQGAHSVTQLPDTQLGDDYAGKIEAQTSEQTSRIGVINGQLKHWREELLQQQTNSVSHHV
jgi:hypothetical protein